MLNGLIGYGQLACAHEQNRSVRIGDNVETCASWEVEKRVTDLDFALANARACLLYDLLANFLELPSFLPPGVAGQRNLHSFVSVHGHRALAVDACDDATGSSALVPGNCLLVRTTITRGLHDPQVATLFVSAPVNR